MLAQLLTPGQRARFGTSLTRFLGLILKVFSFADIRLGRACSRSIRQPNHTFPVTHGLYLAGAKSMNAGIFYFC